MPSVGVATGGCCVLAQHRGGKRCTITSKSPSDRVVLGLCAGRASSATSCSLPVPAGDGHVSSHVEASEIQNTQKGGSQRQNIEGASII